MVTKSTKTKSDFLGIPFGTACSKLRTLILYKLACDAGKNACFKCNQTIDSVETFSIDHKKPWLHIDTELFWNLENIAFSHKKCNTRDRVNKPKPGPDGTAWCTGCQDFVSVDNFGMTRRSKKGRRRYRAYCNACRQKNKW